MISRRQTLLALASAGFAALPWTGSQAAAPLSRTANAGFYRTRFGEFEITALSDGTLGLPMARIYRDAPEAELQRRLEENFLGREPHISINAYLVNDGQRLVLIDTGTGSLFGSAAGKLVRHLAASGYQADQVDAAILTHIHADHSGGLTLEGHAQFPNATIHVPARELAYWIEKVGADSHPAAASDEFAQAHEALAPYLAAGRVHGFGDNEAPIPGFASVLRAGHTPGHSAILLENREGQRLVFWGDIVHGDYVQFDSPRVTVDFDIDRSAAARSRALALEDAARHGYLVAGAHLPFPGLGRVARDATLYRWVRENYVQ